MHTAFSYPFGNSGTRLEVVYDDAEKRNGRLVLQISEDIPQERRLEVLEDYKRLAAVLGSVAVID